MHDSISIGSARVRLKPAKRPWSGHATWTTTVTAGVALQTI